MDTFMLRMPWWPIQRVFSRNPLVRAADRFEALAVLLAVGVSLLTAPFAAAVGTAVHDSRSHAYTQQAQTRHPVTATAGTDLAARRSVEGIGTLRHTA